MQLESTISREELLSAFQELLLQHDEDDRLSDVRKHIDAMCWDFEAGRVVRAALERGVDPIEVLRVLMAFTTLEGGPADALVDRTVQAALIGIFESIVTEFNFDMADDKERENVQNYARSLLPENAGITVRNTLAVVEAAAWAYEFLSAPSLYDSDDVSRVMAEAARELAVSQGTGAAEWVGMLEGELSRRHATKAVAGWREARKTKRTK